jgi:hypothetical protein
VAADLFPQQEGARPRDEIVRLIRTVAQAYGFGATSVPQALAEELSNRLTEATITPRLFRETLGDILASNAISTRVCPDLADNHKQIKHAEKLLAKLGISLLDATDHLPPEQQSVVEMLREIKTEVENREKGIDTLLRLFLPDFGRDLALDISWRKGLGNLLDLLPDPTTLADRQFARAPRLAMEEPRVAAEYLTKVDDMARWIVDCLQKNGIQVPKSVLLKAPSFSWGRIEATGAIAVVFESSKIELWTAFGMFDASDIHQVIPPAAIDAIKEKFQLISVEGDRTPIASFLHPVSQFVATVDAKGAGLPPVFRRLLSLTDEESRQFVSLWADAKPPGRRAVGEEHVLSAAERTKNAGYFRRLAQGDLRAADKETRLQAFDQLICAGQEYLPILLDVFGEERDAQAKSAMFKQLIKYKQILMKYPKFGVAVTAWLDTELAQNSDDEQRPLSSLAYNIIGDLRDVGPIAPEQMVPLLVRSLDVFPDPQWPLDLLVLYGKSGVRAEPRLLELARSDKKLLQHYANRALAALYR